MNLIQLTPTELISFVVEEVQKAVAKAMEAGALDSGAKVRRSSAMRQARRRQRIKEAAMKQSSSEARQEAVMEETGHVMPVPCHVTDHVTGVTDHVTTVTNHVISVTCHGEQDPDPRPPSSPLPPSPQTPLSPAPLHPPTPVEGAHVYVREEGEAGGKGFSSQNLDLGLETQPEGTADATHPAEPTMQSPPDAGIPCPAPGLRPDEIPGLADPADGAAGEAAADAAATACDGGAGFSLRMLRTIADEVAEETLRRQRAERQALELAEARRLEAERLKLERKLAAEAEVWRLAAPQVARLTGIFGRQDRGLRASEEKPFLAQRIADEDLTALEGYYAAHWPPQKHKNYLRHDLLTLLEHYPQEVDRARTWQQQEQKRLAPAPVVPKVKRGFFAGTVLEGRKA